MSTQTEQEKWQELADVLGWQVREANNSQIAILESETEISQVVNSAFRDEIMHSLQLAKQRTHLELAAQEMASVLLDLYRVSPNPYFPWIKKSIEKILKKAGVIE